VMVVVFFLNVTYLSDILVDNWFPSRKLVPIMKIAERRCLSFDVKQSIKKHKSDSHLLKFYTIIRINNSNKRTPPPQKKIAKAEANQIKYHTIGTVQLSTQTLQYNVINNFDTD
jgi:hypothetical protein